MKTYSFIDYLAEKAEREEKYFKNYLKYAKKIKKAAEEILEKTRVIIFGSILRKSEVPQDIDVLIISPNLNTSKKKSQVRTKLYQKLGFAAPFEIHLITPEEYQQWYENFIEEKIEIK